MKKKVASIQFAVELGNITSNQQQVTELVKKAMEYNPDFILLPETWNLGFFPKNVEELAEDYKNSTSVSLVKKLAMKYKVNIIAGSIIIKENGFTHNRALVFNRQGTLVNTYDKGHLFSPSAEHVEFEKGITNKVFELDGIKAAHLICYDLRFPEYSRRLALEGAEVLFISAEWPHPRLNHWKTLNRARAIENQMYVISANGCGVANDLSFCGHSAMIDPWGEILQEVEEEEVILITEIDTETVREVRKKIPVFNDRNLDLY